MRKTLRPIESARRPLPEAAAAFLPNETVPVGAGLETELPELERLSLDDMRLRWRNHWGRLAPAHLSRGLLLRVGQGPSGYVRGKTDKRPVAARGWPSPSISATKNAGERVQ